MFFATSIIQDLQVSGFALIQTVFWFQILKQYKLRVSSVSKKKLFFSLVIWRDFFCINWKLWISSEIL